MSNNSTLTAYIKYFKDKDDLCVLTNAFVKDYQQKIDKKTGYGYINLAHHLEKGSGAGCKLCKDAKEYYDYLTNANRTTELEDLIGLSRNDIINVNIAPEKGGPSQKWHLLVSYLGMKWYKNNNRLSFHCISCPELWLWMIETSKEFDKSQIEEFYKGAVLYKNNEMKRKDWLKVIKPYREKLHNIIMNS